MSAFSTNNTTTLQDTSEIVHASHATHGTIGLSFLYMIINLIAVILIGKRSSLHNQVIYQILQVNCLVSMAGQFGFVIILASNLSDTPSTSYTCTFATILTINAFFNFFLNNLLIACPR